MVAQRGDCTAQNETLRKEIEVCGMGGVWVWCGWGMVLLYLSLGTGCSETSGPPEG